MLIAVVVSCLAVALLGLRDNAKVTVKSGCTLPRQRASGNSRSPQEVMEGCPMHCRR